MFKFFIFFSNPFSYYKWKKWKLFVYEQHKLTVRWIENWLNSETQGIMSNTKGQLETSHSWCTQRLVSGPKLFHILSHELDDWTDCTLIKFANYTTWRIGIMADSFEVLAAIIFVYSNLDCSNGFSTPPDLWKAICRGAIIYSFNSGNQFTQLCPA